MKRKLKLDLNKIKIQSFITTLDKKESIELKGGATYGDCTFALGCTRGFICIEPTQITRNC